MTSTPVTTFADARTSPPLLSRSGWVWTGIVGLLFILVHHVFLERMLRIATNNFKGIDPNWGHILAVPVIAGLFIYQHRENLLAQPRRLCWWGLFPFFAGLFGYAVGIYPGQNNMIQGYSMILTLFGLVLFLLGPASMRVLWFPILFLTFAVKISDRIWEQVAWQLQQVAAKGATLALQFFAVFLDFNVNNSGSTLQLSFLRDGVLVSEGLNVAEACSGLRMLMAFLALAVAMAFLFDRTWWQRLIMVLMAVPIAVAVNVARVTILGLLYLVDPVLAQGSFHTFIGMLMLIPAAMLFMLLGWILDQVIIRDAEPALRQTRSLKPLGEGMLPSAAEMTRALPVGLVIGIVATLLAGAVYAGMFMLPAPQVSLPALPTMVTQGLTNVVWLVAPAALVGTLAAVALVGLALASKWGKAPARRAVVIGGFVGAVLLTAFISQKAVVAHAQFVLIKEAVPLRKPLIVVPTTVGTWQLFREDPPLAVEMLEALGTESYISRIYEDVAWPASEPGRLARVHVAYYTGTPDTVPHVPDRCFVAGGMEGLAKDETTLTLSGDLYRPEKDSEGYIYPAHLNGRTRVPSLSIPATRFTYAAERDSDRVENVLYFFVANGKFLPDPDQVRLQGFDPKDRYSYYCKVEVQMLGVADKQLAQERAEALLSQVLPEILACLPDWTDVTEGRWPANNNAELID